MLFKKILKNKEAIFLTLLLLIGLFLRIYRLEELMTYLGDEGRDMLVVLGIIRGENFPLIGPATSIGNLYLGPIYYYFITPFSWIFNYNPVGPAVFVAILGTITILLVYIAAKNFFDEKTAVFASLLYTFSPLVIKFSRSSWNPNPMPFFTLLFFLGLYSYIKTKKGIFIPLMTFSYAVMLQLHYMAIVLIPLIIYYPFKYKKEFTKRKKYLFISLMIFILLMLPIFIFDFAHQFVNTKGILEIFHSRSSSGFSLYDVISRTRDRIRQLFGLFFNFQERDLKNSLLVIFFLLVACLDFLKKKLSDNRQIIYSWFIWGFISVGLYQGSVHPHYMGFLFPLPAFFAGYTLAFLYKKKVTRIFSGSILLFLLYFQFKEVKYSLARPTALNVNQVKQIVQLIKEESQNKPFNFALLAKNNYDSSYRYFFKLWHMPAVYEREVTKQLFVVCEDMDICQPEGNSKWEIALFDASFNGEIQKVDEWQPDPLLKVFKFIPKNEIQ